MVVLVFVVSGQPMLVQAGSFYYLSSRRLTTQLIKLNNICSWGQRAL